MISTEERILQEMKNAQAKANPVNRRVLQSAGDLGVKKVIVTRIVYGTHPDRQQSDH